MMKLFSVSFIEEYEIVMFAVQVVFHVYGAKLHVSWQGIVYI